MKHLPTFDTFVSDLSEGNSNIESLDEGSIWKFFTGHSTPDDQKNAEAAFMKTLNDAEADMKKAPKEFAQAEKWEVAKAYLMGKASENKFRGGLRIQKGGGNDKRYYIVYDAKATGFQKLAASAGNRRDNPLGGK